MRRSNRQTKPDLKPSQKAAQRRGNVVKLPVTQREPWQKARENIKERVKAKRRESFDVTDIRDDVMSLVKNSRMKFSEIQFKNGPVVATLKNWDEKKVTHIRLETARAILRVLGFDFTVVPVGKSKYYKP